VELAAAFALFGSLVAVAVPTFLREFKASRFVEPTQGLAYLGASAIAYGATHGTPRTLPAAFPPSVGLTPSVPPRGHLASDPPGTWTNPTWQALAFPTSGDGFSFADGDPHAFAFGFDSATGATGGADGRAPNTPRATFTAHAHGDLDGDGATSTFEVHGQYTVEGGPVLEPGLYVQAPLE
jgi:hypothetical protein